MHNTPTRTCILLVAGLLTLAPGLLVQQADSSTAALTITGDIPAELKLSIEEIRAMPRSSVEVNDEGTTKKYEGVWLHEVLKKAGAPLGRELRGKALATYVLAKARDGYQVVFSLGELDPAFRDNEILLADRVDGQPLFGYQGPLRLVVPHDRPGARSIRTLAELEVVRLRK